MDERLYAFKKFVSNIRKLIGTARERGIEVLYVQHDDEPDRRNCCVRKFAFAKWKNWNK